MINRKKIIILILITILIIFNASFAFAAPGGNNTSITHSGATTIDSDTNQNNQTYSSTSDSQSALLVTGGNSTLSDVTITKSGDSDGDNSDFYGTNAAVLVKEGTLNINDGNITTNGSHANAIFAYDKGVINISNSTINTSSNNSGGIMVTGGGTLTASDVTATTQGNSSAPIRSDRGGGTIVVNGGTYTSNGVGSPAIYSTADITVNNAKLVSNVSSGVIIEGKNSITLNNVDLYDSNTRSNTKGEEANYKNIFIYQSASGDASEGTGTFVAKDSTITTANGSTIFVTNTNADITLENNIITNTDSNGLFLKAAAARWGKEGSNGGIVTLKMINQTASGDIVLDNISTLDLYMTNKSIYVGAINNNKEAKKVNVTISKDSIISLTADTYIDSLDNELSDNSNIYSNGKYKLYVDGKEVSINNSSYQLEKSDTSEITQIDNTEINIDKKTNIEKNNNIENNVVVYFSIGIIALIVITICIVILYKKKQNKSI